VSLSGFQSLLLRAPERGQFDSLGHCDGAELRRLAAFGNRLDDPWRQKRQPHHAPHVTARKMFSPGDIADRPCPARQQIVGPSIRSGGCGYMPGAGITGPAGAAAGGAAASPSLGVNIAAGGVKNVTSSTGYLVDKTTDQIVQQVVNYYNRQGWMS